MSAHVSRNHTGHRVGEHHQRARLTDDQVRAMRDEYGPGMGYVRMSRKYQCGVSTVRDIVQYRTRWNA